MPKAYSEDLRKRVWAVWQEGKQSQREVAARIGVSESFVRDLSRHFRATGSVAAKPHGGGRRLARGKSSPLKVSFYDAATARVGGEMSLS